MHIVQVLGLPTLCLGQGLKIDLKFKKLPPP